MEINIYNCDDTRSSMELFAIFSHYDDLPNIVAKIAEMPLRDFTVWANMEPYALIKDGSVVADFERKIMEIAQNYGHMLYDNDTLIRYYVLEGLMDIFVGGKDLGLDSEIEIPDTVESVIPGFGIM